MNHVEFPPYLHMGMFRTPGIGRLNGDDIYVLVHSALELRTDGVLRSRATLVGGPSVLLCSF